jgi:hypothetical protein
MADTQPAIVDAEVVEVTVLEAPTLDQRLEWFEQWEETSEKGLKLSRRDREYYDNKQWTDAEVEELQKRRQPVLTKNRVARKINFILGEEIKKRVDPVARPRTPQHEDSARAATDALRYVEEEQGFDQVRSAVLKDMLVVGFGGAIKSIGEGGEHSLEHVEWDRLFWDPHSRKPDFSDGKYMGVVLWMDLDDALLLYPDSQDDLEAAVSKSDMGSYSETTEDSPRRYFDGRRNRVKIIEMYHRVGDDWFRSDFTQGADLRPVEPTGYADDKGTTVSPLLMASCYVDSDGMRYGVVRALISPQDEINKRSSKLLHLVSQRQVIAERDAITDPTKFQTELAKPDGYAETEPGALTENRIQVRTTGDMAQGQFQLLQEAKNDIDSIGPSSSTLPDLPDSSSGRAFIARQQAASQELGAVFDALRNWSMAVFDLDWICIRQFWTEEIWLRVTDDEELTGYRFVALNQQITRAQRFMELVEKGSPPPVALQSAAGDQGPVVVRETQQQHQAMTQQAQMMAQQFGQNPPPEVAAKLQELNSPGHMTQMLAQHPVMQEQITENQVDRILVDIILDEAPETAVLAQEEFESLSGVIPTLSQTRPDLVPMLMKLLVQTSQLRSKRDILEAMDKPDDPKQAEQQQQAQQAQMATMQAQIAVLQSQAQLNQAKAMGEQADAQATQMLTPTEAEKNQAQAMKAAADAGEKTGMGGQG